MQPDLECRRRQSSTAPLWSCSPRTNTFSRERHSVKMKLQQTNRLILDASGLLCKPTSVLSVPKCASRCGESNFSNAVPAEPVCRLSAEDAIAPSRSFSSVISESDPTLGLLSDPSIYDPLFPSHHHCHHPPNDPRGKARNRHRHSQESDHSRRLTSTED